MSSDLIPGFSSVGMRIAVEDGPQFERLLEALWAAGVAHPVDTGECAATT